MRSSIEQLLANGCQNDEGVFFFPPGQLTCIYDIHCMKGMAWHGTYIYVILCVCVCVNAHVDSFCLYISVY